MTLISGLAQANEPLVKVGEGSAYWGVFKLYDAQFLTEPELSLEQALSDNTLHNAYQPVEDGDCYVLSYEPQIGTQLLLNGQSLVKIKTPDFKALYFGIWVGSNALSEKLKQNLTQGLVAR